MPFLIIFIVFVLAVSSCSYKKKSDNKDLKVQFKEYDEEKIKKFKVNTVGGLFDSYLTENDDFRYADAK